MSIYAGDSCENPFILAFAKFTSLKNYRVYGITITAATNKETHNYMVNIFEVPNAASVYLYTFYYNNI